MKFRKLRIAWSVACGVSCVLLIVLWVRSYFSKDIVLANLWGRNFQANSTGGRLSFAAMSRPMKLGPREWLITSKPLATESQQQQVPRGPSRPSSKIGRNTLQQQPPIRTPTISVTASQTPSLTVYGLGMPYWTWLLLPATAAAIPWIGRLRRFSLRTLLIATTLIAVMLGAIVWFRR